MQCKVLQLFGRSNPNPKKASLFARNRNICEVRIRKVGMFVRQGPYSSGDTFR